MPKFTIEFNPAHGGGPITVEGDRLDVSDSTVCVWTTHPAPEQPERQGATPGIDGPRQGRAREDRLVFAAPLAAVLHVVDASAAASDSPPAWRSVLAYSTTCELLEEVAARLEHTQNATAGRDLAAQCRAAAANLAPSILDFRVAVPPE